jgi:RNA 2',3'-cyclic 3'-phosphodiesterase
MDSKRIFVAIDISDAARAVCRSHIDSLRHDFPQVRVGWERSEKLHVTLKFLGSTKPDRIEELISRVADAAEHQDSFSLRLDSPGSFPPKGKPRVLWIGTGGDVDDLIRLENDVADVCESLGYEREAKPFHPHITIGRVRDHRDAYALADAHRAARIEPVEFDVRGVAIYESKLVPTGSVYTKLSSVPLKSG